MSFTLHAGTCFSGSITNAASYGPLDGGLPFFDDSNDKARDHFECHDSADNPLSEAVCKSYYVTGVGAVVDIDFSQSGDCNYTLQEGKYPYCYQCEWDEEQNLCGVTSETVSGYACGA